MPEPRSYSTEAIIIKKTKLGEADSILTLYTPHIGKIQGFAKSLRKPKSKLAGHLELLTYSQVSLARGKSLGTITGSQTIKTFLPLKSDLWLSSCALYVIELVNQFTADHIENSPLFQLLLETMHRLCWGGDSELVLRCFEVNLLNEVGYRPQLQRCVSCRSPLEPTTNSFCSGAGGVLCPACHQSQPSAYPLSLNALNVLRLMQSGDYETASRLRLSTELSRELEGVMRDYLQYFLEREVKSITWRDTLREQDGQAAFNRQATS